MLTEFYAFLIGYADWSTQITWAIVGVATALVLIRPRNWPEAIWAVTGAVVLVALGLLPVGEAFNAIGKGTDVYLFLTGMMLLSETGVEAGLFDWAAAFAVVHARGSGWRLFSLVYAVGIVVTTFMSNDAAAVVLTPAVVAAAKKAKVNALPSLFACAFIANAASFVLPISNPANIVLYGNHTPALGAWLRSFALPSLASILVTYVALGWTQRHSLDEGCAMHVQTPTLDGCGRLALAGIFATAAVLLLASSQDIALGLPTAVMGVLTAAAVWTKGRSSPLRTLVAVNWAVLPLVAGLFVLVEALARTGVIDQLAFALAILARGGIREAAALASGVLAVGSNLTNNLPAGLVASAVIGQLHPDKRIIDALLIGVDLGPNLSVTGSLATILWLSNLRRASLDVSFLAFLKVGIVVMPTALACALAMRLLT